MLGTNAVFEYDLVSKIFIDIAPQPTAKVNHSLWAAMRIATPAAAVLSASVPYLWHSLSSALYLVHLMTPASLSAETAIQTQTLQLKTTFRPPNALGVAMSSCLRMSSMSAMDRSPKLPGQTSKINHGCAKQWS